MPKAYIVSCYLDSPDEDRLAEYAGLPKLPLMRLAADLLFVLPRHIFLKLAGNSAPL